MRVRTLPRRGLSARRFGGPNLTDILVGGLTTAATGGNILAGLSAVYDTIEIRTTVTPPAVVDLRAASQNTSSEPSPVAQFLKPTIILSGNAGTQVIAPYGEAEGGWGPSIGALLFVVGSGFALGWLARGLRR